jgi:plasmid maintenance system antidote protein VapI
MTTKRKQVQTITQALRDAINDSELSFAALERETGVVRQSLMKFARGERSLRLDMADRLAKYFGLELTERKRK